MKNKTNRSIIMHLKGIVAIGIMVAFFGCTHTDEAQMQAAQPMVQKTRVTRQHLLQDLAAMQIVFSQHGQNMQFIIPTSQLFERHATTLRASSGAVLAQIAHFIATYDIEQIHVTVKAPSEQDEKMVQALSQRQAQIIQSSMKTLLPSVPLIMSHGRVYKESGPSDGLDLMSYAVVGFRYIRKH